MHPSNQQPTAMDTFAPQHVVPEVPFWKALEGRRVCAISVLAYLCSCFLGYIDPIRIALVLAGGGMALWTMRGTGVRASDKPDPFLRLATFFLAWMTIRSLIEYGPLQYTEPSSWWIFGTLLLFTFGWLVWESAKSPPELERAGRWVGFSAAGAAIVSVVLFYGLHPDHVFGERLRNWFIYGGLNPVNTGLTFGFALIWLVCRNDGSLSRRERVLTTLAIVVLTAAVLLTRSRGALLALTAGYAALTCMRGVRQMMAPWLMLVTMIAAFVVAGPLINHHAAAQTAARAGLTQGMHDAVSPAPAGPTPLADMLGRKDSGRLAIYADALRTMSEPHQWLFGVGQWGPGEWSGRKFGIHPHLHSAYLATFVHGGLVGAVLLFAVLGIGFTRAIRVARAGSHLWLALLTYGCAGLIFDGQTLTTLTSLPQMETLLVAFPLVAAASMGARTSAVTPRR